MRSADDDAGRVARRERCGLWLEASSSQVRYPSCVRTPPAFSSLRLIAHSLLSEIGRLYGSEGLLLLLAAKHSAGRDEGLGSTHGYHIIIIISSSLHAKGSSIVVRRSLVTRSCDAIGGRGRWKGIVPGEVLAWLEAPSSHIKSPSCVRSPQRSRPPIHCT
jgi:hypothetical protein